MTTEADLENEALVRAYHVVFGGPDGQVVLTDLVNFCRAADTTFDPNPSIHARNEGRREVYMRIAHYSALLPGQAVALRAGNLERMHGLIERLHQQVQTLISGETDG